MLLLLGAATLLAAPARKYSVGAFYYGPWHVDPTNEKLHGKNWTEWNLVKDAKPRFPGHEQPNVPLWGYQMDSDPQVMAQKIDAAAEHVNAVERGDPVGAGQAGEMAHAGGHRAPAGFRRAVLRAGLAGQPAEREGGGNHKGGGAR